MTQAALDYMSGWRKHSCWASGHRVLSELIHEQAAVMKAAVSLLLLADPLLSRNNASKFYFLRRKGGVWLITKYVIPFVRAS